MGYAPAVDPKHIVSEKGAGAIYTFTREFAHPPYKLAEASAAARARFNADGRLFPPIRLRGR